MRAHRTLRLLWLLPLLALLAACAQPTRAPAQLIGNTSVHDPSMIKDGATYYVFSTGDRGFSQGSIQIRRSADMERWDFAGFVFDSPPAWIATELGERPSELWAPDIAFFGGLYHLYYAGSFFGSNSSVIGHATSPTLDASRPDYAWSDKGMVVRSRASYNWNAIDPNVVLDAEGAPWLAFGSFWSGIKLQRLDPATSGPAADTRLFSLASRGGGAIEAPAIVRRGDFYYLFVSFDLCCRGASSSYRIMVGRAAQLSGPYVDRDGAALLDGGGSLVLAGSGRYRGPGGQSVYLDGGVYRLVHHIYDAEAGGAPKLQIHDLAWDDAGWPVIAAP